MHPGVILASLGGICAALGLLFTLLKGALKAAQTARENVIRLDDMGTEVREMSARTDDHATRIATLEERTRGR